MKRIVAFGLFAVLLLGLVACGGRNESFTGNAEYDADESLLTITDAGETIVFRVTEKTKLIWAKEAEADISFFAEPGWDIFPECTIEARVTYSVSEEGGTAMAETVTVLSADPLLHAPEKPVIYLYPEVETDVSVLLDYSGRLTCTYPAYREGWHVTASPDGTLADASGQTYNYLYWEGIGTEKYDFSQGFCVSGADTAAFLEDALPKLGLTRREANEFIVYWLPRMEQNPYNLIAFQGDAYTESARLTVTPAPDTLIRVFMAFRPLSEPTPIEPQALSAPSRTGFTVVEWGGTEVR